MYFLLERYFIKLFFKNLLLILFIIISAVCLISFLRIANQLSTSDANILLIIKLTFLKAYIIVEKILPIIFHIATLAFIVKLLHDREIIAIKSLGITIWKLIIPVGILVLLIGSLLVTVLNPIGHFMLQHYNKIYSRLMHTDNTIVVGKLGIWFKDDNQQRSIIINAQHIDPLKKLLQKPVFTITYKDSSKNKIIYAESAVLTKKGWDLKTVIVVNIKEPKKTFLPKYHLSSNLSFNKLYSVLDRTQPQSFWRLLGIPRSQLTQKQFNYFVKLCLTPFTLLASFLIAILTLLQATKRINYFRNAFISIIANFLFFTCISTIRKLPIYHTINNFAINTIPLVFVIGLSILFLLYKEEAKK